MRQELCVVRDVREVAENTFVFTFASEFISKSIRPGQFVNLRVAEGNDPLLRRPFSVYRTDGVDVEIIFNVIGRGTTTLRKKTPGDLIDVLGPLGVPFSLSAPDFKTAVLVGGGLGVAPLPITTGELQRLGKSVITFLGARTSSQLVAAHLSNLHVSTDDGSKGFDGTVVESVKEFLSGKAVAKPKIFACGPTAMLRAVAALAIEQDIPCEVSLEGAMGCGFGICQGCPVELVDGEKKYALMCKDGPAFDARKIRI
jgi:dihydroorotate dehydrogenase electron transfer subunit